MSDYNSHRKAKDKSSKSDDLSRVNRPDPGKRTLVSGLPKRIQRKADGVLSTSATSDTATGSTAVATRDNFERKLGLNLGVAPNAKTQPAGATGSTGANAAAAVERAHASSGQPLPGELRGQFEGSLGADLSAVRLHTNSASVDASRALGARAYTSGSDIHFNAGQYDPTNRDGIHLLAHEVAHTVQQSGSPGGPQAKLEVSAPGDACEVEADHAADAMIAGRPAAISQRGGHGSTAGAEQQVALKPINTRTDIEKDGDAGAKNPSEHGGFGGSTTGEQVSVHGKSQAQSLQKNIETWQPRVGENAGAKGEFSANQLAIGKLNVFISASEVAETAVSGFKGLFANAQAEYGRLMAMANSEALGNAVNKDPALQDGEWLADDHAIRASGGEANAEDLGKRAEKLANSSGRNGGENKEIDKAIDKVNGSEKRAKEAAMGVANSATMVTAMQPGLNGAHSSLQSVKSRAKAKEIQAAYNLAKAQYDAQMKSFDDAFAFIDKAAGAAAAGANPATAGAAIANQGWEVVKAVTKGILGPDKPDASEEEKAKRKDSEADIQSFNGALQTFNAEGKKFAGTVSSLAQAVGNMQLAKDEHARNLKTLGQEFDKHDPKQKGNKIEDGEAGTYETIGVFVGQADAFLTSAEATKLVGERDLTLDGKGAGTATHAESSARSQENARNEAVAMTAYRIEDRR